MNLPGVTSTTMIQVATVPSYADQFCRAVCTALGSSCAGYAQQPTLYTIGTLDCFLAPAPLSGLDYARYVSVEYLILNVRPAPCEWSVGA